MINFYDTSSLLLKVDSLFEENVPFAISSITLDELENIKTSSNKDQEVKYAARKLLHILDENIEKVNIVIYTEKMLAPILERDLSVTNDSKILACALGLKAQDEVCFYTNDLALKTIARIFFDNVASVNEDLEDDYTGFIDITLDNDEMGEFYSNFTENRFNLLYNQYLIVREESGEIVD